MKLPLLCIVYREWRYFLDNGKWKDVCENKEIVRFIHAHYLKCTYRSDYCVNRELFFGRKKNVLTYQQKQSNFTELSSANITVERQR